MSDVFGLEKLAGTGHERLKDLLECVARDGRNVLVPVIRPEALFADAPLDRLVAALSETLKSKVEIKEK